MPKSRSSQVSLDATPYYHIISRCVRRAFLCGNDLYSGKNFDHRKSWFEDRMFQLQSVFAIDICAFAVMSNHSHLVVYVDEESAKNWSTQEVVERWHQIFNGTLYTQKLLAGESLSIGEMQAVDQVAEEWRDRLMDISWFVRCLNEHIARKANAEDQCSGRFWEGRFKSQALLDDQAILSCMAYVDLNPLRAQMAKTPEASAHTSIQRRAQKAAATKTPNVPSHQPKELLPFVGAERKNMPKGLQWYAKDYLQLVDWTGRQIRQGKRGSINQNIPDILDRLGIDPDNWVLATTHFESKFKNIVGLVESLRTALAAFKRRRLPGLTASRMIFGGA